MRMPPRKAASVNPLPTGFGLPEGVAQTCNLLYRRFSTCWSPERVQASADYKSAIQQITNLRYFSSWTARPKLCALVLLSWCVLGCSAVHVLAAAPLRFGGVPVELTLYEVSERTLELQLLPLDDQGRAKEGLPSTALVNFKRSEKLRLRELSGPKELRIGRLRVKLTAEPLSVVVTRADGKVVQELVFEN